MHYEGPVVFGQDAAVAQLVHALRSGHMHHAWILHGPQGVGKCTVARECARLMGFPDTFRIPASVSDTRAYQQFGNSVVVPVVREVARAIKPFLAEQAFVQPELLVQVV